MRSKNAKIIFAVYAFLLIAAVIAIIFYTGRRSKDEPIKIGFVTTGSIEDSGWNSTNYNSIKKVCDELGAELLTVSEVDEYGGHCKYAVEEMVGKGAQMIILNSSVLADQMKDMLANYPHVAFYGAGANFESANFSSFSSRMYQARYLSGIVAGLYTKTNKIGFIAAYRETSAYRGINAFTLGVRSVNPEAEVIVAWTESWDNETREKDIAQSLIEKENIDLLTYHQNRPYAVEAAEQYGIASIGYYSPVQNASDRYLTCAMCDWTMVYEKMLRSYMSGQGKAKKSEWFGIESEAIMLTPFSPLVPENAGQKVDEARNRILDGWYIFSGEIYDNEGNERCCEGETLSDNTLLYEMDWLTEGVREYAE